MPHRFYTFVGLGLLGLGTAAGGPDARAAGCATTPGSSASRATAGPSPPLLAHTSYTKLFFQFLFDQEISLSSRIMRKERGTATLKDQRVPDKELVTV